MRSQRHVRYFRSHASEFIIAADVNHCYSELICCLPGLVLFCLGNIRFRCRMASPASYQLESVPY